MVRMPGQDEGRPRQLRSLERGQIPEADRAVFARRGQPAAPRGKGHGQHVLGMALQQGLDRATGIVVQADGGALGRGPGQGASDGQPALLARRLRRGEGGGGEHAAPASARSAPGGCGRGWPAGHPGETAQTRMVLSSLTETSSCPFAVNSSVRMMAWCPRLR